MLRMYIYIQGFIQTPLWRHKPLLLGEWISNLRADDYDHSLTTDLSLASTQLPSYIFLLVAEYNGHHKMVIMQWHKLIGRSAK